MLSTTTPMTIRKVRILTYESVTNDRYSGDGKPKQDNWLPALNTANRFHVVSL